MFIRAWWFILGQLLLLMAFSAAPLPRAEGAAASRGASQPPQAPTLSGEGTSSSSISWTWNAVPDALTYTLHNSFDGAAIPGAVDTPNTFDTEQGLLENTPYTRYVDARNNYGTSPPSNEVRRYTLVDLTDHVLAPGIKKIEISVVPPPNQTADKTGCEIQRGSDAAGWITIKGMSAQYTHVDDNLDPKTTYSYRFRLQNGDGIETDWSYPKSAKPKDDTQGDVCLVTASPRCGHEPGEVITFTYVMINASENETVHFVCTHDMGGSFLFSLPPGGSQVMTVTVEVKVEKFRLHPKAWCKSFKQEELGLAVQLRQKAQEKVGQINLKLPDHGKTRKKIEKSEKKLIQAVEKMDDDQLASVRQEIDQTENDDNTLLGSILGIQNEISGLHGKPPEADAEILELNLILFSPGQLEDPVTVGPKGDPPLNPKPPEFKKKPKRIEDDQEDDPGVYLPVNNDNSDGDEFLDLDDEETDVSIDGKPKEDDMVEFWWFFGKPVDGSDQLRIEMQSNNLKMWRTARKGSEPELPHTVPAVYERERFYLEARKPSTALRGEKVKASYMDCEDKFSATANGTVFLDQDKTPIDPKEKGLHVALLSNAFTTTASPAKPLSGFIDGDPNATPPVAPDPDRFFIRITDVAVPPGQNITAKLRSAEALEKSVRRIDPPQGDGYDITLTPDPANAGSFISKSIILVSDDRDDQYANAADTGSAKDNDKDDRTLKVVIGGKFPKLGGFVEVTYKDIKGKEQKTPIKVCDPKGDDQEKKFKVHFIILKKKAGGGLVVPATQPNDDILVIRERYLQACVTADIVSIDPVDPPAGVDPTAGTEGFLIVNNRHTWSADQVAIINKYGDQVGKAAAQRDHIDVFLIDHFLEGGKPVGVGGNAIETDLLNPAQANMNQIVFVARTINPPGLNPIDLFPGGVNDQQPGWATVAHEIGHLFGLGDIQPPKNDFAPLTNLMYYINLNIPNSIAAPKRFYKKHPVLAGNQIDEIRKDRPFLK